MKYPPDPPASLALFHRLANGVEPIISRQQISTPWKLPKGICSTGKADNTMNIAGL